VLFTLWVEATVNWLKAIKDSDIFIKLPLQVDRMAKQLLTVKTTSAA